MEYGVEEIQSLQSNSTEGGWSFRRIDENAVEEKLHSEIYWKFHFFSGSFVMLTDRWVEAVKQNNFK